MIYSPPVWSRKERKTDRNGENWHLVEATLLFLFQLFRPAWILFQLVVDFYQGIKKVDKVASRGLENCSTFNRCP